MRVSVRDIDRGHVSEAADGYPHTSRAASARLCSSTWTTFDTGCRPPPDRLAACLSRVPQTLPRRSRPGCAHGLVAGLDGAAGDDFSVAEDVGAKATAVDQRAEGALGGEPLQVGAGLTESLPEALDVTDLEAPADERVEVDATGDDVASCLGVSETVAVRQHGLSRVVGLVVVRRRRSGAQ